MNGEDLAYAVNLATREAGLEDGSEEAIVEYGCCQRGPVRSLVGERVSTLTGSLWLLFIQCGDTANMDCTS